MADNVPVADAIKLLRTQLEDAQREGIGKGLRFLAKSVEVELAIVFKTEVEGRAGVKAWFLRRAAARRSAGRPLVKRCGVQKPAGRSRRTRRGRRRSDHPSRRCQRLH